MTVDYDAPRRAPVEADESLENLAGRRLDPTTAVSDIDEPDLVESYELPGADLSDEELVVRVVPKQARRVHLSQLLSGSPPQSAGSRSQR